MMSTGMVSAITPRILVEECGRLGIKQPELLDEVGLSHDCLQNVSSRIPVEKMCILWDSILRVTSDPMFALHVAEKIPFGAYRVLDYMFAASSSPGDGFARTSRAFGMVNSAFVLSLRLHRDRAYLELHNPGKPQDLPRPYIEYILMNCLVRLRIVTRVNCEPSEVHFTCGKPPFTNEYDRVFRAPIRYYQAVNRLIFPRHLMEIDFPLADRELCELLEDYAQRRIQDPVSWSSTLVEIRHALAHNLESGNVTLEFLSRQLAKSCRSLQRDIQADGATFRELLDNVRRERALILLREQDLPIKQVAMKLNFADSSSFCRAFQRWTGESPLQYRNHLT
jgi:AraC-like DNA-binding protein